MTKLEQAWRAWRTLSQPDRYKFLVLLRGAYAQERETVLRQRGARADGVRVTRLSDLALSEADLNGIGLSSGLPQSRRDAEGGESPGWARSGR
ncbi:hypothetical protein ABIG06_001930 [Bradyrhizobium sp. USDA 326]